MSKLFYVKNQQASHSAKTNIYIITFGIFGKMQFVIFSFIL